MALLPHRLALSPSSDRQPAVIDERKDHGLVNEDTSAKQCEPFISHNADGCRPVERAGMRFRQGLATSWCDYAMASLSMLESELQLFVLEDL
jgi:hypothetical protein